MSAPQQFMTGEPVITTSDSKQLAYNGMFDAAQFAVQRSLYSQAGLDPQKSYTLEYVQSLTTLDQLLKVFWGDSPCIVIIGEEAQTEALYSVAEHIAKLLPTLGSLTVVLLADLAGSETANFIKAVVEKGFPLSAERIWRTDRLVSSSLKGKQWIPRVLHTTHNSRSLMRRVAFKKFCLQMPGHDPELDWYPVPPCPATMLAVQYHKAWESDLLGWLKTEVRNEVVVPGPDIEHTRVLFREFDKSAAAELVEQFGRLPRFAVMGVPRYNGTALQEKPWRLSAFIKKDHKIQHAPFLFSCILAAFWDMGEILGVSTDVALQASAYNQVRIGFTASAMEHFRPAMLKLNESVGLVVVDEGSQEWLTDSDNDSTSAASTVPDDWGTVTSVYATNVPPWYNQSAVTAMISATGDTKFVADRMRLSFGELRTCTWKITGLQVEQLVGDLLRSTKGGSPIHIVSANEYKGKRNQQRHRPARTAKPATANPPEVEMMDLDSVKFMKRKRGGVRK